VRTPRDRYLPPDRDAFVAAKPPTGRVIVIAPTRAACETIELAVGLHLDTFLERTRGDDLRRLASSGQGFGIVAGTVLGIMSLLVWFYILYNALRLVSVRRRYQQVMDSFWEASSPRDAIEQLKEQPEFEPFSKIALDAAFAAEQSAEAYD
jgi:hypothetical protein